MWFRIRMLEPMFSSMTLATISMCSPQDCEVRRLSSRPPVAAAFDLGEMQGYVFENFTHDWRDGRDGVVDWITDALAIREQAAPPPPSHFRVTVDELPHHLGRTEPDCDCLSCNVLADYAFTVELATLLSIRSVVRPNPIQMFHPASPRRRLSISSDSVRALSLRK